MNQIDKRLERLERGQMLFESSPGGQVHQSAEHIAQVLEVLEGAGAIHFPYELPESERAADVVRQLAETRQLSGGIDERD